MTSDDEYGGLIHQPVSKLSRLLGLRENYKSCDTDKGHSQRLEGFLTGVSITFAVKAKMLKINFILD